MRQRHPVTDDNAPTEDELSAKGPSTHPDGFHYPIWSSVLPIYVTFASSRRVIHHNLTIDGMQPAHGVACHEEVA